MVAAEPRAGAPDPTEPGVDIPDLKDKYTRKIPKQVLGLDVAHKAMCLADAARVLAMSRRVVNAHNVATLGDAAGLPEESDEDDDMGIHVGDIVVNNGPADDPPSSSSPPPATSPTPSSTAPIAPASSGLSNLAKAGILAATLGSGASIPLAVNAVANWLKPSTSAASPADPGAWQLQLAPQEQPQPTQPAQ
jgi:hypothetical protein